MFTASAFDKYERWEAAVEEFAKLCAEYTKLHRDIYCFEQPEVNTDPEAHRVNEWSHDTTKLDAEIVKVKGLIASALSEYYPYIRQ